MDTFTCSSWYYLRYCDPHNAELPFSRESVDRWMPVDNYIGGIEHAILHLLYSRFWTKVLRDLGMIDADEPFTNLLCQGMVKDEHGDVMSKSKGNVVPPSSVIGPYGADTMRLVILFIAPPEKDFGGTRRPSPAPTALSSAPGTSCGSSLTVPSPAMSTPSP